MFEITFIGHQGWQFSAGGTNVLLDPLLVDGFGHDPGGVGFDVFPPRRLDLASCPPIDAVLFSHEHEDHFNVASIEQLDRKIPLYLSSRSSSAAERLLTELGFQAHRLSPGEALEVGSLSLLPISQASLEGSHPGEWDALALYVSDRDGDGSFFTTVDHRPQMETFDYLKSRGLKPTVVAYADNDADHSVMYPWVARDGDGNQSLIDELRALLKRNVPRDLVPRAILLCANGFAPRGEQAWMNESVFHRDPRAACAALRPATDELFLAPNPGQTVVLSGGRRMQALAQSPWIQSLPEEQWPERGGGAKAPAPFSPATGRLRLSDTERDALPAALDAFAQFLYGTSLFKEMYLLDSEALEGRRATMGFVLMEGDEVESAHANPASAWVWNPTDCSFSEAESLASQAEWVAGARCWASDLLAVLRADMPAASLTMGRLAGWNEAADRLSFDLPNQLHMFCHPLRQPDAFLELYRGLVTGVAPSVRSNS